MILNEFKFKTFINLLNTVESFYLDINDNYPIEKTSVFVYNSDYIQPYIKFNLLYKYPYSKRYVYQFKSNTKIRNFLRIDFPKVSYKELICILNENKNYPIIEHLLRREINYL